MDDLATRIRLVLTALQVVSEGRVRNPDAQGPDGDANYMPRLGERSLYDHHRGNLRRAFPDREQILEALDAAEEALAIAKGGALRDTPHDGTTLAWHRHILEKYEGFTIRDVAKKESCSPTTVWRIRQNAKLEDGNP